VDHATHPFGLAVPSGFISTTGVGGLTLGGGIGYLSRKYGLTIDNLLGVDVVLADGRWSRPAPKNVVSSGPSAAAAGFGVVTSFRFGCIGQDGVCRPDVLADGASGRGVDRLSRLHPSRADHVNGFSRFSPFLRRHLTSA
jgi:hypothetical protein